MEPEQTSGRVTLTRMLKVLDKDVASGIEKRLKKLSKKKALEKPLNKNVADQLKRKAAYGSASTEVSKWEPVVKNNRRAKQLKFPLDQEADFLPSTADSLADIQPRNELEAAVKDIIDHNSFKVPTKEQISEAEERYQKAVSTEEAEERHRELQRMRVLLGSYAAKMRRQKHIKSKSYRRLLKHERLKSHMKKVETDKDALMDEIERLHRLRAQERASLKHKNTGKWAKHAKFRAKYDDEARKAMMEQIGIAEKLLERPAELSGDSDSDDDGVSDVSEERESGDEEAEKTSKVVEVREPKVGDINTQLMISSEILNNERKRKRTTSDGGDSADSDKSADDDDSDDEDNQRKLMSEAFADDDVVAEFKKAKEQLADEEQPKDKDLFLPGWNDWAGPGTKEVSRRRRKKFIVKAKKIKRQDDKLGNVIISEHADDKMKDFMLTRLPRFVKNDRQLEKQLTQPIAGTFVNQTKHRESIKPRIQTRMGARIEPLSKKMLKGKQAKWAE